MVRFEISAFSKKERMMIGALNLSPKLTRTLTRGGLAITLTLAAASLPAQDVRKVLKQPAPPYPEMAKRMHLTGTVKVQVVIGPDGLIKEFKVVGGHPVLVESALETLKMWKFAPASGETTTILEFNFHPAD
jgi:TonB family protein